MDSPLRRMAAPLRRTPLHPQWFCFRDEVDWLGRVAGMCSGVVLDVGCGRQRVRPFINAVCHYVGIDYPQTSVAMYRTPPQVYADGSRLPVADGSVDTLLLLEVLEHLAEPGAAVSEAARALRPGGTLVISVPFLYPVHDFPHDYQRWTPVGVRRLLERPDLQLELLEPVGTPLTSAALLLNIALAQTLLDLMRRRNPLALLATPVVAVGVPLLKLWGWTFQSLGKTSQFMPFGVRAVARKASTVHEQAHEVGSMLPAAEPGTSLRATGAP